MSAIRFREFSGTAYIRGREREVSYGSGKLRVEAEPSEVEAFLQAMAAAAILDPPPLSGVNTIERAVAEAAASIDVFNPAAAVAAAQDKPEVGEPEPPPRKQRKRRPAEPSPEQMQVAKTAVCAACGKDVELQHHRDYGVIFQDHVGVDDVLVPADGQCCVGAGDAPSAVEQWVADRRAELAAPPNAEENGAGDQPVNGAYLAKVKSFTHVRELLPFLHEYGFKTADDIVEECKRLAPEVALIGRMQDVDSRVRRAIEVLGIGG